MFNGKPDRVILCLAHPKSCSAYFFFSLWDKALAAILLVLALDRPSCNAFEAFDATDAEVTFLAIWFLHILKLDIG